MRFGVPPAAGTVNTSTLPSYSPVNAMVLPSAHHSSPDIPSPLPRPINHPPRPRRRHLPILQRHFPIHHHIPKPHRILMRLLKRTLVPHRRRIEHHHIRLHPHLQHPAIRNL